MSKIIRMVTVIGVTLAVAAFIVRMLFGSSNSLSYKIFKAEAKGYYFHKLLGIVPSSYQDRYSKTVLDSFDNTKVINLVDDMGSSHQNFIVLSRGADSKFLKAYPFELVGNKEKAGKETEWNKHVSLQISTPVFNDYVDFKQLKSKRETIEAYCYFLSDPSDESMHKILSSVSDLDSLIASQPLHNLDFLKATGQNLIDVKEIDFDQPDGTVFCWFKEVGVVKFTFLFNDDNTVQSVDSEIIGVLGNETPVI